jgi:hypothetical protein
LEKQLDVITYGEPVDNVIVYLKQSVVLWSWKIRKRRSRCELCQTVMERDEVIDKIQKLLVLAEQNPSYKVNLAVQKLKLISLMADYEIDEDMLFNKEQTATAQAQEPEGGQGSVLSSLLILVKSLLAALFVILKRVLSHCLSPIIFGSVVYYLGITAFGIPFAWKWFYWTVVLCILFANLQYLLILAILQGMGYAIYEAVLQYLK